MKSKVLIYTVFVLAIFAEICDAQVTAHKISIIDKSTMEPIPFARVSFGRSNGVYSDLNGQFTLAEGLTDSIVISHISYKDTIVLPKKIKDNIIFLTPASYALDEVVVTKFTGSLSNKGTSDGKHHSSYAPLPFTVNALYIPYDESWSEAPQVNEIFLDLDFIGDSNATIQYYLSMPDSITGNPNGKALSRQAQLNLDRRDKKIENRYYSKIEQPFIFPKTGLFIVFFVADASYSYSEMLSALRTKKFRMAKYLPYGFYITAQVSVARSWWLNVYAEESTWVLCGKENSEWSGIANRMSVGKEGEIYNFMGGVNVQLPK